MMARRPDSLVWPSLDFEGHLIAPAMLDRIQRCEAPQQQPADYRIANGMSLREAIATAFQAGAAHIEAFRAQAAPGPDATRRFAAGLLQASFGFGDVTVAGGMAGAALLTDGPVPVVVVSPAGAALPDSLDDTAHGRSGRLWGLATDGVHLRLLRRNPSLTRPAWIEADLEAMVRSGDLASFALLWLLVHRSRFGAASAAAADCPLEGWREAGGRAGEAARDRLAGQVRQALAVLGSGFLEANPDLAEELRTGTVDLTAWFNELLRLVYRLIFLMVAEDRGLLHPARSRAEARDLYARGYSLASLRARCGRAASRDRHHDRYEGIQIVFAGLAHGEPALALPALGGLFAEDRLPRLANARLRNRAFMQALDDLAWLGDKTGLVPVNWRAMETEELGSVYESLLELQPRLGEDGQTLHFDTGPLERQGNQRKTTGSYYTPDSLVQALLDTALDPVLERAEAGAADPAAALLRLSVIDPACGSGHFLLAAARRIATRVARRQAAMQAEGQADGSSGPPGRSPGRHPGRADFRHALREVVRRCIHGVDRNPMAVELTRVALWIETVDPGRPLGFLDAQIRCGDSLLGVFDLKVLEEGIPDAACKPLAGDDKDVARHLARKNRRERGERSGVATGFDLGRARDLSAHFQALRAMPEDTVAEVEAKSARLQAITARGDAAWQLATACDLFVAAFLLPKTRGGPHAGPDGLPRRGAETVPTSGTLWEWLRGVRPFPPLFEQAMDTARNARAFHWPLAFPDIMAGGGFDVVLGNPPWERIKLQEKEFFAARDEEIATAPNAAARTGLIDARRDSPPGTPHRKLWEDFQTARRQAAAFSTFVRLDDADGGRFPYTGTGDVNTYALFAELFARLPGDKGRAGIVVPTGIATDATTAPFLASLVGDNRLASLTDFENSAPLFTSVHRSFKFCLLTLGRHERAARFAFFLTRPAQQAEPERTFTLSQEQIAAFNPNTRTLPVFRSGADAELAAKIYRHAPVLIDDSKGRDGNPWGVSFMAMFHMSNDSGHFRTAAELFDHGFHRDGPDWRHREDERHYVPLREAKTIHQYDHRWAGYGDGVDGTVTIADSTEAQKQDRGFEPSPRYWVPASEVATRLSGRNWNKQWLMGWRDITNATNERTVIATVFPAVGVGHNLPLILPDNNNTIMKIAAILAHISSSVFDFTARLKIGGTHLTYFIIKQLPILPPAFYSPPRLDFVVPRVLELTFTSHSLTPFARDLGHTGPPFAWDADRRAHLRADLDAFHARAYGLTRDELRYILDPADLHGPDYPSETFRVLQDKEIRQHGEYRTRRLVLEAWDRMATNGTFKAMDM